MAVFQVPTDGIADGAITTAKINASVSLGASVNVILDGTDGGGSNAGDNLILDGTDNSSSNAGDKVQYNDVLDANAIPQSFGQSAQFRANTKFLNETLTIPQGVNAVAVGPLTVTSGNTLTICLLYTSPSPRDLSTSRMPSSA